ncbi:hypothetical protein GCM10010344_52160 [Streptomyces bluensis]|nr:hypothetical protein GCM10010344_52160 [Streptomyces bluensis]
MTGSLLRLVVAWDRTSTQRRAQPGSVTEDMKELAGQGDRLVDSYERGPTGNLTVSPRKQ